MKFIHIADLHLGKRFNDVNLLEDQEAALSQIVERAVKDDIDAVIIAGDIYDKASPQADAMAAFDSFVSRITAAGKKIYMISGNHDSDKRIAYFSDIIKSVGIYTTSEFDGRLQLVKETDDHGELNIYMLPFIKPVHVRRFYPDETIETYEDAVRCVIKNSDVDPEKRNILICHQFITGAETCDSETLSIGGLDNISASAFEDFDYVALGHIHKAQKVSRETLRYSGSLLKYSFSEAKHKKSFCIAEIKGKGEISTELVPVNALHDVIEIDGMYDELMKLPRTEDYASVTIHDEDPYPDARMNLLQVFPNMMSFIISNSKTEYSMDINIGSDVKSKSVAELFCDFYIAQNGSEPSEEIINAFNDVYKCVEGSDK